MRSLRRFTALRVALLAFALSIGLTVVTPASPAVARPQAMIASPAPAANSPALPIQFVAHVPIPTIEWWLVGGHLYNASSSEWTYYVRNSTGKYHQLPNGLLYSVGWHSQSYKVYPVGPGTSSAFMHDADMFWVPPGKVANVRLIGFRGQVVSWGRAAPGGNFGAWYKVKPQYYKWMVDID